MKQPSKKPKKQPYIDDGHTIYDMSGLTGQDKHKNQSVGLTKEEKRAAISAAFSCYLPLLAMVLGSFLVVMLLIKLWLHA